MKRILLIATITLLFACCEKEDDDNNMDMTTPGYISSDCEGF